MSLGELFNPGYIYNVINIVYYIILQIFFFFVLKELKCVKIRIKISMDCNMNCFCELHIYRESYW